MNNNRTHQEKRKKGGIKYQILQALNSLEAFGTKKPKGYSLLIHGRTTKKCYEKCCLAFAEWSKRHGLTGKDFRERATDFACAYLAERAASHLSAWTLKMERSALRKLMVGLDLDPNKVNVSLPRRRLEEIKRSRSVSESERQEPNYRLLAAVGLRRFEAERAKVRHVYHADNGRVFIFVPRGKGGRLRVAPVIDEQVVLTAMEGKGPDEPLFDGLPRQAHAARRDYAKKVYREAAGKAFELGATDKNAVNDVTQSLGHNRLDVAVDHYLRDFYPEATIREMKATEGTSK